MMLPRVIGLAVGLFITWMVFFGAGYFGAVWTHYFADEPPKSAGEVSVKVIESPQPYVGLFCPGYHPGRKCPEAPRQTASKPHE
jgi:hypothetical protein